MDIAGKVKEVQSMSIKKKLLLQHLLIVSLTVVLLETVFFLGLITYYYTGATDMLKNHAVSSAHFANRYLELSGTPLQQSLPKLKEHFQIPQAEMQVLSPNGNILYSTVGFSQHDQIKTPDMKQLDASQANSWIGKDELTNERILAVAIPLEDQGYPVGILRYVASLKNIDAMVIKLCTFAVLIGISIILIVMLLSITLANSLTKPLLEVTNASKQLAKGHLETRMNEHYRGEFGVLAKSFNEMGSELLRHEKMKNEFISSISHELRTPLTSIKGWSETILTGNLEKKEETKSGLRIILTETDRLIEMVEELLDFSRFTNETMKIQRQTFQVAPLLHSVIKQFEKQLLSKKQKIELQIDGALQLYADQNRIKQVFINMIDNAIKYSEQPGTITISCRQEKQSFICDCTDQGIGIKKSDLVNIQKMFYKVNENSPGAGLGLAICQHILQLHHGKLMVTSSYGKETTISFTIPLLSSSFKSSGGSD